MVQALRACADAGDLGAELSSAVAERPEAADALMRHLYRGLRRPDNAAMLLRAHGLLVELAGMGTVMRAVASR